MNTDEQITNIYNIQLAMSFAEISSAARWGVKFATGHPDCLGKTMRQVACEIGYVSSAIISKYAVMFCEQSGLPPSDYMKTEIARKSARSARNNFLDK